jgi:hypothetical protein
LRRERADSVRVEVWIGVAGVETAVGLVGLVRELLVVALQPSLSERWGCGMLVGRLEALRALWA